ncbi:MAG: VWA domain-containing protein [Ferruginibacter sp.]|nr:von Willebrand factor type A domain-containing protein [Chitinophagaceae bacterium]MBP6285717.1 von Willebrand factor type A domain-containing protein [Ferruginibacter sp.]MBU9936169.1 VWA domain-containing protein [Ferruginibacter sp.]
MKKLVAHIPLLLVAFAANAQYYLRGEITDEKNQPLQNVKILLHSKNQYFYSGTGGGFGITSNTLYDSLTLFMEGYESKSLKVNCDQWQYISLKVLPSNVNRNRPKLISVTKNLEQTSRVKWYIDNETYFQLVENDFVNTVKYPNTGFSLNVNKASYSNVRRFINMQSTVPPDAVRTEEVINYFNLHYREPAGNDLFRIESQLTSCPWDMEKMLLVLNLNARKLDLNKIPPGNFVFLIDASGSMDMPNRLPLLKAAFQLFVKNLRPIDTVSIVTYGGTVGVWLQPTSGAEKEKIIKSIEELTAMGDTPGQSAIMAAYMLANKTFIKGGSNRVIMATDGDFNVGASSEKELEELITKERQSGVYLTCLGVGMGNFKDSKLETLAKKGNGNYAYIDDIREAEKVLVKELTQTFYGVADDVFMNIQFNPNLIKEYRLIGFDNRRDAVADSTIDIEGGELGSGNSVLAYFEIVPATDQLFKEGSFVNDKVATVNMRYSRCNDTAHLNFVKECPAAFTDFKSIDRELQFATAVTMFGLKVKQSKFMRNADWPAIRAIAVESYNPNSFLQAEFLQLIDKAEAIYTKTKKKKKKGGSD